MLRFYFNPKYKYTNRTIIDTTGDNNYQDKDYLNIDSPDTINGHIIYSLQKTETFSNIPTYIREYTKDENNNITYGKRWFVSGITQLNSFKFQISLLRDIISENPELWKSEEAYINAGKATNYNKYKVWGLPYTNTKIREQKLTINGKPSFFVFYTNTRNVSSGGVITEDDLELSSTLLPGITTSDYTVASLSEIPSYQYVGAGNVNLYKDVIYNVRANVDTTGLYPNTPISRGRFNTYIINSSGYTNETTFIQYLDETNTDIIDMKGTSSVGISNNVNSCRGNMQYAVSNFWNTRKASNVFNPEITQTDINNLSAYLGKTVYDQDTNKVYRLKLTTRERTSFNYITDSNIYGTLRSAISNINWPAGSGGQTSTYAVNGNWLSEQLSYVEYSYTWEILGNATSCSFNFIANQRKLPKSAVRCVNIVSDSTIADEELAQSLMIMQANDGNIEDTGKIIDIQYLPFSVATTTNNNIKVNNTAMTAQFLDIDDFYYTTNMTALTGINKETDSIKIVSPSRASQFLFKPYNNDGRLNFTTKITIKPYTSVIYIRPSTQGLLINDWDDKDCLVISEDMSLTQLSSDWANYVYSNRNYQNAFNRTIQGREYERTWERKVEEANMAAEEWNAKNITAQRAKTMSGNIPIFSDFVGAIGAQFADPAYMNAVQMDLQYNEAMHQESISLARDQFNYQIDNLKSQPTIPSKITVIDSKLLDGVYLEYYSTNDTELSAIESFYKYNANRIDDYGTFNDYWCWFVRGKIIKSQYYTQPEINEINIRLNAGIFTGEEYNND